MRFSLARLRCLLQGLAQLVELGLVDLPGRVARLVGQLVEGVASLTEIIAPKRRPDGARKICLGHGFAHALKLALELLAIHGSLRELHFEGFKPAKDFGSVDAPVGDVAKKPVELFDCRLGLFARASGTELRKEVFHVVDIVGRDVNRRQHGCTSHRNVSAHLEHRHRGQNRGQPAGCSQRPRQPDWNSDAREHIAGRNDRVLDRRCHKRGL